MAVDARGYLTPVVALGGSFAEPGSPLVSALSPLVGVELHAQGYRGASLGTWSALALADGVPAAYRAIIVFELGGNEGGAGADPGVVRGVHARLEADGAKAVWVLPPVWFNETAGIGAKRRAMRAAILAAGVPVIDSGFRPTVLELAADGVHLTRAGAERFAAELAPKVRAFLNVRWKRVRYATLGIAGGVALAAFGLILARRP